MRNDQKTLYAPNKTVEIERQLFDFLKFYKKIKEK